MRFVLGFTDKPKDFYVYLHRRLDTMEVFYVGKGSKDRAWVLNGRIRNKRSHWANIAKKHGVYIEIVQDCLQEWYALELEISLISYYGRSDLKLGKLTNKTDGGESGFGIIFTEATRAKLKACQLKYGKHITVNNTVCFLTIKDAAKYLIGEGKTDYEYRTASSALSNCLHKRIKSYKNNIVHFSEEDYDEVVKEIGDYFRSNHSDEVIIEAYRQYMSNTKTIVQLSNELGLRDSYLQCLFKGKYRCHLNLVQKTYAEKLKFNNTEIVDSLEHMTAIEVMKKYNISKTHLYRIKKSLKPVQS